MTVTANLSTLIGAGIAIFASILNAVGYTLQKQGHNRLNKYNASLTAPEQKKKIISERIWVIGFSIFIVGGLANAMALYYAPQSLVLPLSAFTLVVNTYGHCTVFVHTLSVRRCLPWWRFLHFCR